MTQLVSDVSARLGYKYPLKVEQVLTMFDDCRYQQAWELVSIFLCWSSVTCN